MSNQSASVNEAFEGALLWALFEVLESLKHHHKGVDNALLRDVKSLHHNMTKRDMPEHIRKAVDRAVAGSIGYVNTKGYTIRPK